MRLYEVGTDVHVGFKVSVHGNRRPAVNLAIKDDETGGPTCIALGNSICRELRHHDDREQPFVLKWANSRETTAGYVLVAQSEQASIADGLALVIIDRCKASNSDWTRVDSALEYNDPEHITFATENDVRRDLFLFREGDGLRIRWSAKLLGTPTDLLFILSWTRNVHGELALQQKVLLPKTRAALARHPEYQLHQQLP